MKNGEEPDRPAAKARRSQISSNFSNVRKKATRACYEALKDGWNDKRRDTWIISFGTHILPLIGEKPIDKVDSAVVRDALAPIWLRIAHARGGAQVDLASARADEPMRRRRTSSATEEQGWLVLFGALQRAQRTRNPLPTQHKGRSYG